MRVGSPPIELVYCTNIHPGETLDEVEGAIDLHARRVRDRVADGNRMGLGLRLSGLAARELRQAAARERLVGLLGEAFVVPTLNGFPFGRFHGVPVKEQVYRPDWSEDERVVYTRDLIDLIAVLPAREDGPDRSISTLPGCFRERADASARARIATNLLDAAAHAWRVREGGGPIIVLALEPEPWCMLETIAQTIEFFDGHLRSRAGVEHLARTTGLAEGAAEAAIHRHLGVCLDACHAAVEFEDARGCVDALVAAGIRIAKVQVSTGLELAADRESLVALRRYADDVWLHQVVARRENGLAHFVDLPQAIAAHAGDDPAIWRVHFHVPVFMAELGRFRSTQAFLGEILNAVRARDACRMLEVETYTWDVLPSEHRAIGVDEAIARELEWTRAWWCR